MSPVPWVVITLLFLTMCLLGKIYRLHFIDKDQSLSLCCLPRPLCLYLILALTSLYYNDVSISLSLCRLGGRGLWLFHVLNPRAYYWCLQLLGAQQIFDTWIKKMFISPPISTVYTFHNAHWSLCSPGNSSKGDTILSWFRRAKEQEETWLQEEKLWTHRGAVLQDHVRPGEPTHVAGGRILRAWTGRAFSKYSNVPDGLGCPW